MSLSALSAMMFKKKVDAGIYPTEPVMCFCGSNLHRVITNKDRYGFEHIMCLCVECGLMYANPRMTKAAYDDFYENHYRDIYGKGDGRYEFGGSHHSFDETKELIFDMIEDYEMGKPKVVFEVGCGEGDALNVFKGFDTVGVDLDKGAVERGIAKGRNIIYGGINALEGLNKKADLIILNHVVEHFLNLEDELLRVRKLLSDNGLIYLAVPGLYCWDKDAMFQNAHTYQFNANSLDYVMGVCGFEELYLNDNIESIWCKGIGRKKSMKPSNEASNIVKFFNAPDSKKFVPMMRVGSKFSARERRENIKYAIKSGLPQITRLVGSQPNSKAVLICGGPSIKDFPLKIRELQLAGAKVYTIERMYKWCLDNKIIPDYSICMDASDDVIQSFDTIDPKTTHIIMAQCKPEVIDLMKNFNSYYFLVPQKGIDVRKYFKKKDLKKITWINPAGSVSLGALAIAVTLGARYFHIFGFDCHVSDGDYAKGITGVGYIKDVVEVEANGKIYNTTPSYMAFMQQFFKLYEIGLKLKQIKDVKIYGDSMIKTMSKNNLCPEGEKQYVAPNQEKE